VNLAPPVGPNVNAFGPLDSVHHLLLPLSLRQLCLYLQIEPLNKVLAARPVQPEESVAAQHDFKKQIREWGTVFVTKGVPRSIQHFKIIARTEKERLERPRKYIVEPNKSIAENGEGQNLAKIEGKAKP
jgi:hypothetical protein